MTTIAHVIVAAADLAVGSVALRVTLAPVSLVQLLPLVSSEGVSGPVTVGLVTAEREAVLLPGVLSVLVGDLGTEFVRVTGGLHDCELVAVLVEDVVRVAHERVDEGKGREEGENYEERMHPGGDCETGSDENGLTLPSLSLRSRLLPSFKGEARRVPMGVEGRSTFMNTISSSSPPREEKRRRHTHAGKGRRKKTSPLSSDVEGSDH